MPQSFNIAPSSKIDGFFLVGSKSKVTEEMFWNILKTKVKEITADKPEKYDETFNLAESHLLSQSSSLTILDTWFLIKGRK
jgi:hypothetical protein